MSRTISGSSILGVVLTNQADNPVTVTGTIAVLTGSALQASSGASNSWTITNAGTLSTAVLSQGVMFGSFVGSVANGILVNQSSGVITAGGYGVFSYAANTSVTNAGTITGGAFKGVYIRGGLGTVVNTGRIVGGNVAVYEYDGGRVTNAAGGTITGAGGVWLQAPGTVSNAGVITGTNAGFGSVLFNSTAGENRLIAAPGAVFNGKISALAGGTNVMELAAGAGTGTLSGFGSSITNFGTLLFDTGASWLIQGSASGIGTIHGFSADDGIHLAGFAAVSAAYAGGNLVLTNAGNAHTTLHFAGSSFDSGLFSVAPDGSGGTNITVACFAGGTRITTTVGPVAVEALRAGDMVVSALGGAVPVVWVGHRHVDCRRHPRPHDVLPVRVCAHAFGPGLPARDLRLSPDHSVHVGDVLIPIRLLINGATVVQERVDSVTYYHVELPAHDILFAEGLPAESYLDTGNRDAFANGGGTVALHPDFARQVWEAESCAPLVQDGPTLQAVRAGLCAAAAALGFTPSDDAGLLLMVGDQSVAGERDGSRHRFILSPGARLGRLVSRRFQPARVLPGTDDDRELGIAVAALALDGIPLVLDTPALGGGWHPPEPGLRWTTGDAVIALDGCRELAVEIAVDGRYWARAEQEGSRDGAVRLLA